MSKKDKWVRRFSVDETAQHKNGFTIYKITSVLFPLSSPEAVTIVKVWKRFSEARALHSALKPLHSALMLKGDFPELPRARWTYYSRFKAEVIEERAKSIKKLLDFIADHPLLFTSNQFVTFLQNGHTHNEESQGLIRQICDELSVPHEEYLLPTPAPDTSHNDENIPSTSSNNNITSEEIKIFESTDIEFSEPKKLTQKSNSFDSLDSLQSIDSDVFDDISKISLDNVKAIVKPSSDLIDLNVPSTSNNNSSFDKLSVTSISSQVSNKSRLSVISEKSKTLDSYIFEAGYLLNLAARSEENEDFGRAFDYYKSGIEKLLIGVQSDPDPARCVLVKKKIDKYLAYAENIHKNHFLDQTDSIEQSVRSWSVGGSVPLGMLRGHYSDLANYRVLGTVGTSLLVLDHNNLYKAIKVIQKIPNNLTEFDSYIPQRQETKVPILPNNIPYMVQLYSFIETNDLIFLILQYTPGEKLINYIKKYVKTTPKSPEREVDLENVFSEPKKVKQKKLDLSVTELVENSQKLISDVDSVLKEDWNKNRRGIISDVGERKGTEAVDINSYSPRSIRDVIPSAAIKEWAAQLIICLQHLHDAGVVCRDLNPDNILLGDKGQIVVTYTYGYREPHPPPTHRYWPYWAPELYRPLDTATHTHRDATRADYWTLGAVLYHLLCGECISEYHRGVFTSHTILHLPEHLTLEESSLLTQLLTYDPSERLGSGPEGIEEIKRHPYFSSIDWQSVYESWIIPD